MCQLERLHSTPLLSAAQRNREVLCTEDISSITKETGTNRQLVGMHELQLMAWQMKQYKQTSESDDSKIQPAEVSDSISPALCSLPARDISTWVAGPK